jgi:hypothetical protein
MTSLTEGNSYSTHCNIIIGSPVGRNCILLCKLTVCSSLMIVFLWMWFTWILVIWIENLWQDVSNGIFALLLKKSIFIVGVLSTYRDWQLYNVTDFILTKIEVPSMMQCMPSKCPHFICWLVTPQCLMLRMTGNTEPCCSGSETKWSQ